MLEQIVSNAKPGMEKAVERFKEEMEIAYRAGQSRDGGKSSG